ncbi:MAG: 4-(cytidine 5'-diphospho)-2-C-methyl-D-erythritol kinase [Acidimicrobiales bacterium]
MRRLSAPAKLTVRLRVTGRRADGYHLLDAVMVSLDLADELEFDDGDMLTIVDEVVGGRGLSGLEGGGENLVAAALGALRRRAAVRLIKRIPLGAGLGGGSTDAAAVLRWARCSDLDLAARLGADVPFCVRGGRARVRGIGEEVEPLAFVPERYLLALPPFGMDTAAVYRAYDAGAQPDEPDEVDEADEADWGGNDLEAAAIAVEPRLVRWRDAFGDLVGSRPRLAGSGSTWFVPEPAAGAPAEVVEVEGELGPIVSVCAVDESPVLDA